MQISHHRRVRRASLITLHGSDITLEPLAGGDWREIQHIADDPAFDLLLRRFAGGADAARSWTREARAGMRRGTECCWLIRDAATGALLGSTRFLNVDAANSRLEIGATWLLTQARGTTANPESKLLLLRHAFEHLDMRRVHIQSDSRNARSRAAIEALGATYEGILRQHIVLPDGTSRDTAVYSIVVDEWPQVRSKIEARIAARGATPPIMTIGSPSSDAPSGPLALPALTPTPTAAATLA